MERKVRVDNKLKRKKRITLFMITLLLIAILFTIVLTTTDFFHIKRVNMNGNDIIPEDKILLASGINMGQNIFKLDIKEIESNLLRHPYVKEATVKRKFPSEIQLTIKERKEVVIYNNNDNSYLYIDNNGYILSVLAEKKDNKLPLLISDVTIPKKIGEQIDFEKYPGVKNILKMLIFCNNNDFSFDIDSIIHTSEDVTLKLTSGTNIAIGRLNDIEYKLRLIDKIVSDLQEKETIAKEIYLNKGKNPIIVK